MEMRISKIVALFCVFLLGPLATAQNQSPPKDEEEPIPKYGYYYKGKFVALNPSKRLVAIDETAVFFSAFVKNNDLERDPLSDEPPLKGQNLKIYRSSPLKSKATVRIDLNEQMALFAHTMGGEIQPVFEQGRALLIPSDEIIVGFKEATSLNQAKEFLASYLIGQGIVEVREHRGNTFIVKINSPSDGRAYQVSQFLAKLDGVQFAEPNHIVVMLDDLIQLNKVDIFSTEKLVAVSSGGPMPSEGAFSFGITTPVAPTWNTIASLDCESGTFPPPGWEVLKGVSAPDAYWGRTNYLSHNGSYSIYCANSGSAGVAPPGPVPTNMLTGLRTPVFDLTPYEEVYIEVWFYAKNDLWQGPGGTLYDYAAAIVFNEDTGSGVGYILGVAASGDCTADPTTNNGWRKLLFRVPPAYRVANAFFEFRYQSDSIDQFEGAYLDDIRIIGTAEVDTEPLGIDTYSARQYELKNVGQIAGLGNDNNDMHVPEAWDLPFVSVSPDVVVAVIDEGVDLTHPDLNLVQGYDFNGSVGGWARGSHGTAVAGNIGAIGNNSIGVMGTAPNVKIMSVYFGSTFANMANAIDVAVAHGADVLSNSWGWAGAPSSAIEGAISDALADNRVVLFAAGNGPDRPPWTYEVFFPCNLTGTTDVICVGASSLTDEHKAAASSDGAFAWGSSYVGSGPDICAPSPWSYTTDRQGGEGYNDGSLIDPGDPSSADYTPTFGGTSSSTPKVAGIVALILSAYQGFDLTPADVKTLLRNYADDIDAPGIDDKTGAGRVNAYQALLGGGGGVVFKLAVDFGTLGLWQYDGSGTWSRITPADAQHLAVYGSKLVGDFGSDGLWEFDGSSWIKLTPADADNNGNCMVAYGTSLVVDLGTLGLWQYDGSSTWSRITPADAQHLGVYGSKLVGDFGSAGLWEFDGSLWTKLTPADADNSGNCMVAYGASLVVDLGTLGLWQYDGTWSKITLADTQHLGVYGSKLVGDFGGDGLWEFDGSSWIKLTPADADNNGNCMVARWISTKKCLG
jgi:hypothetical protein